jgi:hypothetical protein
MAWGRLFLEKPNRVQGVRQDKSALQEKHLMFDAQIAEANATKFIRDIIAEMPPEQQHMLQGWEHDLVEWYLFHEQDDPHTLASMLEWSMLITQHEWQLAEESAAQCQ